MNDPRMTRRPSRNSKAVLCCLACICCLAASTGRSDVSFTGGSVLLGGPGFSGGGAGWPLTIPRGAFYAGFGELEADVRNEGTTEPGFIPYPGESGIWASRNLVGTLPLRGNFTQTPGGTLSIDVKGPKYHDVLAVKGTAKLSGTLRVDFLRYRPRAGDRFPILKAREIVGKFTKIQTSLPGRYEAEFETVGGIGFLVIFEKSSSEPTRVPTLSPRG